ncbi:class I SAM-dependent methyltransferase [Litoricolaceae bacterium]|nr:class I SAM-dependent methyltransferase [Litorivicinaceae bacterium]
MKQSLVEIPCPICACTDYRIYLPDSLGDSIPVFGYKWTKEVGKSYRYVRCICCHHIYASPIHRDIPSFYEDVSDGSYQSNSEIRKATAENVLRDIVAIKPNGRLLDVGCATGDFIEIASRTFVSSGLELSRWALDICREKGLDVHDLMLEDFLKTTNDKFDVITIWGVIEHMEDPRREIAIAKELLAKDGILCIWTGDSDSFYAKILKHRWWYVMGQHLQLFSRKSLNRLLANVGFELIREKNYPYVISMDYLGKRLGSYWFGKYLRYITSYKIWRNFTFKLEMSDQIFSIYRKVD